MPSNDDDKNESKSCCTWPKVLILVIGVAVGGILIWKFAPIDEAIDSVLPTFNNTGGGDSTGNGDGPVSVPTSPPTQGDRFEFMQCQDPTSGDCCNGLDNICDLGVDDILYATVHNAMATFEDGFLFGPNHRFKLESALEAGYRGINLDVCKCNGVYTFCHGVCSLGSRDVVEVFTNINQFMDDNPNEVLVIPMELNSEVDGQIDIDELYGIMTQVPGFTDKFYAHPDLTSEWPTLRELIATNKRIIMFHFRGSECGDPSTCPPGLHFYLDYATNTPFDFGSVSDVEATSASCKFGTTPRANGKTFFGVNDFQSPPSQSAAQTLNSLEFAKNRIDTCSELNEGLDVNFIYADFWNEGDLIELTQQHNAALAARRERRIRGSA